ncbi:GTP cyclohydrolase I [Catalinimonas alkaloidigena]|uniref:GTP cyclohydrolase I FolE n=1 Tax=Catalinimonas alkaloidigena TaxID=1075417 RepID=UPI002405D608|nr:GTP cyclohydrolase I FolE [Catalinimonas alkaloidigena]MDF9800831.1 GTP cyclohydrolase I [Catalinimonas alkaloidigena]
MNNNQVVKTEKEAFEIAGDQHLMTSVETPLRADAFQKPNSQKIENITKLFEGIMEELGLDLRDDSLKGTPYRVAKMYVEEIFSGLNPENKPFVSVFDNKYQYSKMLVEKDITFYSACEHHFLPIVGKAHVGYVSHGKVIGLSKINRLVEYYGKRPQVQERMTLQIYKELQACLQTEDVIVLIEAEHLCVSSRGVKDTTSRTTTIEYGGAFSDKEMRDEFHKMIG